MTGTLLLALGLVVALSAVTICDKQTNKHQHKHEHEPSSVETLQDRSPVPVDATNEFKHVDNFLSVPPLDKMGPTEQLPLLTRLSKLVRDEQLSSLVNVKTIAANDFHQINNGPLLSPQTQVLRLMTYSKLADALDALVALGELAQLAPSRACSLSAYPVLVTCMNGIEKIARRNNNKRSLLVAYVHFHGGRYSEICASTFSGKFQELIDQFDSQSTAALDDFLTRVLHSRVRVDQLRLTATSNNRLVSPKVQPVNDLSGLQHARAAVNYLVRVCNESELALLNPTAALSSTIINETNNNNNNNSENGNNSRREQQQQQQQLDINRNEEREPPGSIWRFDEPLDSNEIRKQRMAVINLLFKYFASPCESLESQMRHSGADRWLTMYELATDLFMQNDSLTQPRTDLSKRVLIDSMGSDTRSQLHFAKWRLFVKLCHPQSIYKLIENVLELLGLRGSLELVN